jgi:hypothetical protein
MEDERNVRKPMNQYNALKQALKPHLGWHGARLSFLALFLLALLKVKTVNLKELALGFEGRALVDWWCSESVETSLNETPKFKAIDK